MRLLCGLILPRPQGRIVNLSLRSLPPAAGLYMSRVVSGLMLLTLLGLNASHGEGADLLVADRLTNSVYRYSELGDLLGTVLTDNVHLSQPSGMALSPDRTKLYVSSFQNSQVVRYDYNPLTGTATNATVFATSIDGIVTPGGIAISGDGQTIYVATLGGTGVVRFKADGSLAGAPLMLGSPENQTLFQFSGLAWTETGELLVAAFHDYPAGTSGAIARWVEGDPTLELLIGPSPSLSGASSLLVDGDDLYVTGMFASNVQRFELPGGTPETDFLVEGIPFPQSVIKAPDGNGLLVGVLGFAEGTGDIARYDLAGNLLEFFLSPGNGGFEEPTVLVIVPDILAGDFNGDGHIDAADYLVWRNTLGSTTDLRADANRDGTVDADDYLAWKQEFVTASSGALANPVRAIPEPAGLGLLAFGLLAFGLLAAGWKRARRRACLA